MKKSRHLHLKRSLKRQKRNNFDVWASISFLGALRFAIMHNNCTRVPFRPIFICQVSPSNKKKLHPFNFVNGKANFIGLDKVWHSNGSAKVEEVWMVQCGPNGLLSEIGARSSLIHQDGDIITKVLIVYKMTVNGYVRI
jgi:hypothetical protein